MSNSDPSSGRPELAAILTWSRERDYRGHSKHDALNSPFLSALSLNQRMLRLVAIQAVMRFPLNTRPLFGVPRRQCRRLSRARAAREGRRA